MALSSLFPSSPRLTIAGQVIPSRNSGWISLDPFVSALVSRELRLKELKVNLRQDEVRVEYQDEKYHWYFVYVYLLFTRSEPFS